MSDPHKTSKLLARQLRATLGAPSREALAAQFGPEASLDELRHLAARLPALLERVDTAYLDMERDLALVQRSLELSSAELNAARDVAEQANAAKSRFLANVSHELRTPVNGLAGMTQLMLMGSSLSDADRARLEVMDRSTRALQAIISDLLDWAQADARRVRLEREPFSVRELMRDVMVLLQGDADRKGLQLRCHLAPDLPPWLLGDAGRLRQILLNLIGNAVKFTDRGHVVVTLSGSVLGEGADAPYLLHGSVRDTGPGIPDADRDRIFQPFQQADGSITRRHGGTGLGLAISANLVHLMEGTMCLDSRLGEGSEFSFTVRLGQVAAEAAPQAQASSMLPAANDAPRGGLRVLVVEDNPVNQVVARAQLEHLGCEVSVVEDGESALALPVPLDYDLVLMDLNMPGLSGLSVAEGLRRREAALAQPHRVFICALTACASDEDRQMALAAGMDEHIAKPVRLETLDALLQRLRHPPSA
ncbi:ATP-binding protein [Ideonella paludis]|uniref:histidine kinase n=1 Tax=Ideonella paludis TaxID=1233411 RepID=A0ABS5DSL7_9BURK|nr:ATP-binding protein [Ideonella paludis]MBQ0934095.1 response regulator [Ideonella paludis]